MSVKIFITFELPVEGPCCGLLHAFTKALIKDLKDLNVDYHYQENLQFPEAHYLATFFIPNYGWAFAKWIKTAIKTRPEMRPYLVKTPSQAREQAIKVWKHETNQS